MQRSNALLAEAHSASEQHRATLDSLRQKLRALDAEALGRAASDAATVKQQVSGPPLISVARGLTLALSMLSLV